MSADGTSEGKEFECHHNLLNVGKALFRDDLMQDIQMANFATDVR